MKQNDDQPKTIFKFIGRRRTREAFTLLALVAGLLFAIAAVFLAKVIACKNDGNADLIDCIRGLK